MDNVFAKNSPKIKNCERSGYSFYFDLISLLWEKRTNEGAIHRLCSLMRKMGAKTLINEELEPDAEILQEFQDLEKRIGEKLIQSTAIRISFFSCSNNQDWRNFPKSAFLGYAVILKIKFSKGDLSYILESVTRPPGWVKEDTYFQTTNYYIHCHKTFKTIIGTKEQHEKYSVDGAFFCQQNGLTHVCAHAALRTMLNTVDGLVNHKVTNSELNNILIAAYPKDFPTGFASNGMKPCHMEKIAASFGLNTHAANLLEMPTVDYAEWIYPFVESGFPVLLAFCPTHQMGHVVAVLGHTMNSDKWDCEAHLAYRPEALGKHIASSAWVDHFIINDDNFGMYSCMPPSYLRNKTLPQYDITQRATYALTLLPLNTDVPPYFAEKPSMVIISNLSQSYTPQKDNKWLIRLWEQHGSKGIVARTVICKRDAYIESIKTYLPIGYVIPSTIINCSEDIILTEISLPDLYTCNKHKIGDIISDSKGGISNGNKFVQFIWGWLPGIQFIQSPVNPITPIAWPIKKHIPLLRHPNTLNPFQEW